MKSYKDKKLLFALVALGLCAGLGGRLFESSNLSFSQNTNGLNQAAALLATQENLTLKAPLPPDISLGFVGNIVLDKKVAAQVTKNLDGNYSNLFANAGFLKGPDIMFANLGGAASEINIGQGLKDAGIDVVSIANTDDLSTLLPQVHDAGLRSCGAGMTKAEAEEPAIFSKDGFTVGYLCFSSNSTDTAATDTQAGLLLASNPEFDSIVGDASKKVDALIVSFNPAAQNQKQSAQLSGFAQSALDNGAAMTIGADTKTTEDVKASGAVPSFSSLGNFIFDASATKSPTSGLFLTATLNGKTLSNINSQRIVLNKNFVPSLAH